ncbi:hypothetical protein ACWEPE_37570, partial [Streptomyces sp. NPDC004324]
HGDDVPVRGETSGDGLGSGGVPVVLQDPHLQVLLGAALVFYGVFALSRTRCLARCTAAGTDGEARSPRREGRATAAM